MNSLTDTAHSAAHVDGWIVIRMQSGAEIRFPVADNPRLAAGTPWQLNHIEISPFGLHWPDLDEASFRKSPKSDPAPRMKTSRAAVDRMLDGCNPSMTLATLEKAARALGQRIKLELIPA